MAFISQEDKKELMPGIKKVLKTFNMKGTVSINNHSTKSTSINNDKYHFKDALISSEQSSS